MPEWFDAETLAILTVWSTAMVAGIRKRVPEIDGAWVLLLALGVAAALTLALFSPDWAMVARNGAFVWLASVGGVSFLDRAVAKATGKVGAP